MAFITGTLNILNSVLSDQRMANPLGSTSLIDALHPRVRETAARLTAGEATQAQKARRLHDFVRDEITFGWTARFHAERASDVLRRRVGFSQTKSTLLLALLRAAGIPSRPRFVSLQASLLRGLLDPGTETIDHGYVEIWLAGRWVAVDSHVVDLRLADAARRRLAQEGADWGYGVHADGRSDWDGRTPSFVQFVAAGERPIGPGADLGLHADAAALYESGQPVAHRPSMPARWAFKAVSAQATRRAEALRSG